MHTHWQEIQGPKNIPPSAHGSSAGKETAAGIEQHIRKGGVVSKTLPFKYPTKIIIQWKAWAIHGFEIKIKIWLALSINWDLVSYSFPSFLLALPLFPLSLLPLHSSLSFYFWPLFLSQSSTIAPSPILSFCFLPLKAYLIYDASITHNPNFLSSALTA